jgi:hypothetical protein
MEAAEIESNPSLAPSPPLPVNDAPASHADDSHAIGLHLNGLIARIAVARRRGNIDLLDLIGTVPDPEPREEPANTL